MSEETIPDENEKATEQQSVSAELTINDLNGIKQIIDVSIQRGAFKPNELVTVGTIYNKLEMFLTAVTETQNQGE